jgi:hypothetical protein
MEKNAVRRVGLTVAVALLVGLAGCSGLGLGGNGAGDGYGVSGDELDGTTLAESTAAGVESAGSYTTEQSSTVVGSQQGTEFTTEATTTTRVDFGAGQGFRESQQSQTSGDRSQEIATAVYTDGDTSYRQRTAGGNVTYDTQEGEPGGLGGVRPVNVTAFDQRYAPIVDGIAWEEDGTEQTDGATVTAYAATGVENESQLGIGGDTTVEGVNGSLLVDSEGIIRGISLDYNIEAGESTTSLDAEITLTGVGSTDVEEPEWLSEAQSQS